MKLFIGGLLAAVLMVAARADQMVIRDPAEYNAYISALNTADPAQKAAAMEAFVAKYPDSVERVGAREQAMAAYQQTGNQAKVEEMAGAILKLEPDHVRALAIVTFLQRAHASGGDKTALAEVGANAERGLKALETWAAPEGVSDADFPKLRNQMAEIFNGAAGFAALQKKEYAAARGYYLKSVQIDPANLQDVYQLAIADLQTSPVDATGFWYLAKAIALAEAQKNEAARQSIAVYGKAKYRQYHGSEDGWNELLAATAGQPAPPDGFAASITRAPTPAEIAVKAVIENDADSLSFSDWEYVLSYRDASPANEAAAKKIWAAIEAKQKNGAAKLAIPAKIVSVDEDVIHAAITDENQKANKADLEITLQEPFMSPAALGARIVAVGVLSGYKLSPFMFIMKNAELRDADSAPATSTP
ncbi:MAG TPA: hypothetical protein VFB27_15365 [Opitutaceae bacterium]|nr:hypothetical protein [Opitutaceae bacterium]